VHGVGRRERGALDNRFLDPRKRLQAELQRYQLTQFWDV
jgi:hypothetical protein